MNFLRSILSLFIAPLQVKVAKLSAPSCFNYKEVSVCCTEATKDLTRQAIDEVIDYYGTAWDARHKVVREVVVNDAIDSFVLISTKTIIVCTSDRGKIVSSQQLAAYLITGYEMISSYLDNGCRFLVWRNRVVSIAGNNASAAKAQYLQGREFGGLNG